MKFIINTKGALTDVIDCEKDVVIPAVVDGITIREIAANVFPKSIPINITILAEIDCIYDHTFEWLNLKKITIPNSVKIIGMGAFKGCTSLTNIEKEAFYNCPNLKNITIPAACEVAENAFD